MAAASEQQRPAWAYAAARQLAKCRAGARGWLHRGECYRAAHRRGGPAHGLSGGFHHSGIRLLDDLNLDSIKAGELVAEALRALGAAGALDATRFANSAIVRHRGCTLRGSAEDGPPSNRRANSDSPRSQARCAPPTEGARRCEPDGARTNRSCRAIRRWTRNFEVRAVPRRTELMARRAAVVIDIIGEDLADFRFLVFFDAQDRDPAGHSALKLSRAAALPSWRPSMLLRAQSCRPTASLRIRLRFSREWRARGRRSSAWRDDLAWGRWRRWRLV